MYKNVQLYMYKYASTSVLYINQFSNFLKFRIYEPQIKYLKYVKKQS